MRKCFHCKRELLFPDDITPPVAIRADMPNVKVRLCGDCTRKYTK